MNPSYALFSDHTKSIWSIIIAFVWGFAEATAFFIVPDVYLGFVALFNCRQGLPAMIAALIGAIVGGSVMYILAMNNPSGLNLFLTRIPLINATLVDDVANKMRTDGLITMLNGPLRGIPYKIYAVQAGEQSLPFLYFLLMTIPARLERFLPVVLVFGGLGKWFGTFCEKHTKFVVGGYALMWGIIYFVFVHFLDFH